MGKNSIYSPTTKKTELTTNVGVNKGHPRRLSGRSLNLIHAHIAAENPVNTGSIIETFVDLCCCLQGVATNGKGTKGKNVIIYISRYVAGTIDNVE